MTDTEFDGRHEPTKEHVQAKMTELYMHSGTEPGLNRLALLYLRQNGRCFYCRRLMVLDDWSLKQEHRPFLATINHYLPRLAGGVEEEGNSVAACFDCNRHKGHKLPGEFVPGIECMKVGETLVRIT